MHRLNTAERAIITCKNHFTYGFSTTYPYFPISKWYRLLSQYMLTLNLLHNSMFNPALSVYAYLFGPYGFNKSPMAPPGTCVIVHTKLVNRTSYGHHGTKGLYIGPSLDHYICIQWYMPATGIVRITYTLQYIQKAFSFPKTTIEYYLQQAIGEIIAIINDTIKTLPFLYYGDAEKNAIHQIAHIL